MGRGEPDDCQFLSVKSAQSAVKNPRINIFIVRDRQ
jgi:hypothetical protein